MSQQTLDDVLSHYGVKGMKWGVRRSDRQLARAAKKRKEASEDAEKASEASRKAKKKGVQSLSNSELRSLNERLNLEQQYSNLTSKQTSAGKKFAKEMAADLAKQEAKRFAQDQIRKTLRG